ncbi:ATP-binding protein [Puia sp.]|jgi:NadR type nicotinamide-nucleotide adenylyltransferase|uniref:ATP-binding protein n=1 Tax=Puia sp. TaxID=2045100 RepID=UPI002F40B442
MPLKKIVIIGPESTGKSSLCEELARHYQTDWVPEYAREYLTRYGMDYRPDDLLVIARGQLALEEQHAAAAEAAGHKLLFIDTDMYVMKVWSEFVFGRCDPWILGQIVLRQYHGYLLCRTDLPWAPDPLREYPEGSSRDRLFQIYRDCLINQSTPWEEIGGQGEDRIAAGIAAVEKVLLPQ